MEVKNYETLQSFIRSATYKMSEASIATDNKEFESVKICLEKVAWQIHSVLELLKKAA